MTEVCQETVGETASPCALRSRAARRRRMEMRRFAGAPGSVVRRERRRGGRGPEAVAGEGESSTSPPAGSKDGEPSYGLVSSCGRSRDMEDAVSARPRFFRPSDPDAKPLHLFAVYDGHGGSHVAMMCKERMHRLVAEELGKGAGFAGGDWRGLMKRCFARMDEEVMEACSCGGPTPCVCEQASLVTDVVGSTAVVAVIAPDVVVVANCGDSRAVLCRSGRPVPLSTDHKPDQADELARIEASGGRVIYLNGPRVYGILAMSRAIGDKYLKPIVSSEPEVTITERSSNDECLILASDGLWDVLPNDVVCKVAWNCLRGYAPAPSDSISLAVDGQKGIACIESNGKSGSRCALAAMLLTKLALARRSSDNISVIVIDLKGNSKRGE
ncbi:probable protein phosphatase 2C 24 isoform X1 [Nymphaea colorata]|nr:probable protein phosphatase 2C 24 isoform X1 [Nymphaea colorata]